MKLSRTIPQLMSNLYNGQDNQNYESYAQTKIHIQLYTKKVIHHDSFL